MKQELLRRQVVLEAVEQATPAQIIGEVLGGDTPEGHLEKPRFLGRLMMQLPDLTKADFSNLRFFEVPGSGSSRF